MGNRAEWFHGIVSGQARGVRPGLVRAGLWWARLPYAVGVRVRNRRYDSGRASANRASVPVVSVGNLTLGGTGKTPCVEYIARVYRELGVQVAVLSRGYGAEAGPNDEAMVLEENLPDVPHLQGADRSALSVTAVDELGSELLVLDDGFQHRRLARDLDIVLLDATRPVRAEYLFPRGLLREPVSSLGRADVVILTRCDQTSADSLERQKAWLAERFPGKLVATTIHAPLELLSEGQPNRPVDQLRGRAVGMVCGLGHPEAFRRTLEDLGANLVDSRTYPDHHPYTRGDIDDLRRWASELPADAWVATSQKDGVKLRIPDLSGRPVWAVRVGLCFISGEQEFRKRLELISDRIAESTPE